MLKYLRIAVTALSLTTCVLLVALWIRSYSVADQLTGPISSVSRFEIASMEGQFHATAPWTSGGDTQWRIREFVLPPERLGAGKMTFADNLGFGAYVEYPLRGLYVPHWCPVLLTAAFAVVPWLRFRFSMRTMLIATTLVAVGLGFIVAAS